MSIYSGDGYMSYEYTVEEDTCHDIDTEVSLLRSLYTVWTYRRRDNITDF